MDDTYRRTKGGGLAWMTLIVEPRETHIVQSLHIFKIKNAVSPFSATFCPYANNHIISYLRAARWSIFSDLPDPANTISDPTRRNPTDPTRSEITNKYSFLIPNDTIPK